MGVGSCLDLVCSGGLIQEEGEVLHSRCRSCSYWISLWHGLQDGSLGAVYDAVYAGAEWRID